jgi:hypothetical protein
MILKEKSIFETLNYLQNDGQFLHGYFWSNLARQEIMMELHKVYQEGPSERLE